MDRNHDDELFDEVQVVTPPADRAKAPTQGDVAQEMTDDSILAYTQNMRGFIVRELTKDGLPGETADRNVLLQTLRDMSGDALTKKKIGSEEKVSRENAKYMVAAVLAAASPTTGRRVLSDADGASATAIEAAPQLGDLPEITIVPDEMTQGPITDTYESFEARVKGRTTE